VPKLNIQGVIKYMSAKFKYTRSN